MVLPCCCNGVNNICDTVEVRQREYIPKRRPRGGRGFNAWCDRLLSTLSQSNMDYNNKSALPCSIGAPPFDHVCSHGRRKPLREHFIITIFNIAAIASRSNNTASGLSLQPPAAPTSSSGRAFEQRKGTSDSSFQPIDLQPLLHNNDQAQSSNHTKTPTSNHNYNQLSPPLRNHHHVVEQAIFWHSQDGRKAQGLRIFIRSGSRHRAVFFWRPRHHHRSLGRRRGERSSWRCAQWVCICYKVLLPSARPA